MRMVLQVSNAHVGTRSTLCSWLVPSGILSASVRGVDETLVGASPELSITRSPVEALDVGTYARVAFQPLDHEGNRTPDQAIEVDDLSRLTFAAESGADRRLSMTQRSGQGGGSVLAGVAVAAFVWPPERTTMIE
jgi:hypothetical protein